MIYVFTSAAPNYVFKVETLMTSIMEHHPEWERYLVLDSGDLAVPQCSVIHSSEVYPDWPDALKRYTLVERCTAVKPWMFKYLFHRRDCDAVLYFDPDIVLFSNLDDLVGHFRESSILLTPHITHENRIDDEGAMHLETTILGSGVYNLGFIGVKNDAEGNRFVHWWGKRLLKYCYRRPEDGYFVDQRWVDLVPGIFKGVTVVQDSRFNVAPWNIVARKLGGNFLDGFTVDGKPLGFYHFTGFDVAGHEAMLDSFAGESLSAAKELIHWYRQAAPTMGGGQYQTTKPKPIHPLGLIRHAVSGLALCVTRPKLGLHRIGQAFHALLWNGLSGFSKILGEN